MITALVILVLLAGGGVFALCASEYRAPSLVYFSLVAMMFMLWGLAVAGIARAMFWS